MYLLMVDYVHNFVRNNSAEKIEKLDDKNRIVLGG